MSHWSFVMDKKYVPFVFIRMIRGRHCYITVLTSDNPQSFTIEGHSITPTIIEEKNYAAYNGNTLAENEFTVFDVKITGPAFININEPVELTGEPVHSLNTGGVYNNWRIVSGAGVISDTGVLVPTRMGSIEVAVDYTLDGSSAASAPFRIEVIDVGINGVPRIPKTVPIQLSAYVNPQISGTFQNWRVISDPSIPGNGNATIDQTGKITGTQEGNVTVQVDYVKNPHVPSHPFDITVSPYELPVIFVVGISGNYQTWDDREPPESDIGVMRQIINEGYMGYTSSVDNLERKIANIFDSLSSTNGNWRKFYDFTFYNDKNRGGPEGQGNTVGAIGSNNRLMIVGPYTGDILRLFRNEYIDRLGNGTYAQRLSEFIDKVLTATGAPKVNIVAHSMGGVVTRSALKYYNTDGKVHRIFFVTSPFRSVQENFPTEDIADGFSQTLGYDDGDYRELRTGIVFEDNTTGNQGTFQELLGENGVEGSDIYAMMAGTRNFSGIGLGDDGVLSLTEVLVDKFVSKAKHAVKVEVSHTSKIDRLVGVFAIEELSATASGFTREFTKAFILEGTSKYAGAYDLNRWTNNHNIWPNPWTSGTLYANIDLSDLSKALVTVAIIYNIAGEYVTSVSVPLYKYGPSSSVPILTDISPFASGVYFMKIITYSMDVEIFRDFVTLTIVR